MIPSFITRKKNNGACISKKKKLGAEYTLFWWTKDKESADAKHDKKRTLLPDDFGLPKLDQYEKIEMKDPSLELVRWNGKAGTYELELEVLRRNGDNGWNGRGYIMTQPGVAHYTAHTDTYIDPEEVVEELNDGIARHLSRLVGDSTADSARIYNTGSFVPVRKGE